jgi:hypothetical protein
MRTRDLVPRLTTMAAVICALLVPSALVLATTDSAGGTAKRVDLVAAYHTTLSAPSVKETFSATTITQGKRTTLTGSGVVEAQGNATLTITGNGISVPEVIDNGVLYVKLPAGQHTSLHVSTPWVSLNLNSLLQSKLGANYQEFVSDSQQGPSQELAVLQGASASGVHKVGTSVLFGSKTTEYSTTIDLHKAADEKPGLAPVFHIVQRQLGTSKIPIHVWLDSQEQVRKLVEHLALPATRSHPAVSVVTTFRIVAFNVPVSVVVPPASQVTDVTAAATGSASA